KRRVIETTPSPTSRAISGLEATESVESVESATDEDTARSKSDKADDDSEDDEEAYLQQTEMTTRQLGNLPALRTLVDFSTAIHRASQKPPEFQPTETGIQLLDEKFGPGSYGSLETLAHGISLDPDRWNEGYNFLNDFCGDWTGKEPKFSGSDLSSRLVEWLNTLVPEDDLAAKMK
ncbi:MAG: hypothetical protein M1816_005659, partial [Peltula sp. TS41687]